MKVCDTFAILNENHEVVPMDDCDKWVKSYCLMDRHVGFDHIGSYDISTVFLGINHGFFEECIWFETMIFLHNTFNEIYCDRYKNWDEAVAGHKKAIEYVKNLDDQAPVEETSRANSFTAVITSSTDLTK